MSSPTSQAHQVAVGAASSLRYLDADGKLLRLDSFAMLDLSLEIESRIGVQVPVAELKPEMFRSLEGVEQLIASLLANAPRAGESPK